jgi:microcystin degradation protein MlrC
MRIGILGLLHESNTFVTTKTKLANFKADLFLEGKEILRSLSTSHHEIGGFIRGLERSSEHGIEIVPLAVYRATPSGPIEQSSFIDLTQRILRALDDAPSLDGLLVAAHGAAVAQEFPDADGAWLALVRAAVGPDVPMIATLDPHGNLSPQMVEACNALIAYRSNPHLDQRQRGEEAANLLIQTLLGKLNPIMRASFPPLVINIERQLTTAEPLASIYKIADQQLQREGILGNSIFLGFPYSDVDKMGAATLAISDGDPQLAQAAADKLAHTLWEQRSQLKGVLVSVSQAIDQVRQKPDKRYCLLDMGDNVGGGSAADGTTIARELLDKPVGKALICIYDPEVVELCSAQNLGTLIQAQVGGKTDSSHGTPLELTLELVSVHAGLFRESKPRHGGIVEFDQGTSVVAKVFGSDLTLLITSKRMVPFSLEQLRSCHIDPTAFRVLVAKGVHAPVAAYREVCDEFIRVNTPGSTSADLSYFAFHSRRKPLYPFEEGCRWK